MLIPELDCELISLGQSLKEGFQSRDKLHIACKDSLIEKRKLKNHRPELVAEKSHRLHELLKVSVAIDQNFFMCDRARNFHGESEIRGCFASPVFYRCDGRAMIKGRIDFNSVKARGVIGDVVRRFSAFRIESTGPAVGCESGGSEIDGRHDPKYSAPIVI